MKRKRLKKKYRAKKQVKWISNDPKLQPPKEVVFVGDQAG
jgi:hypothetical protein